MIGLSIGSEIAEDAGAKASAVATVIGPNLPTIMREIRIICEGEFSSGVIPVDSPTVPKAESTSNSVSERLKSVNRRMVSVAVATNPKLSMTTVIAWRITFGDIALPNTLASFRPRITEKTVANSTKSVVILIPPAVPAGPPPMNINMSIANRVESDIADISIELNPVVLV